jgi:hypothetical protein
MQEMDFRRNWLSRLFGALSDTIDDIERRLKQDDYYDGIDALEDCESILGIAFIAAETYIVGTVSDINSILGKAVVLKKHDLLVLDMGFVANGVTPLQLVHAIANYQKHHDEWGPGWKVSKRSMPTITVLNACGISKETEFPCYAAATLLWPEPEIRELSFLLQLLEEWRKRVFNNYRP